MNDIIHTVNRIRNVSHTGLNTLVKKVAVILTSPRSGSSLVKAVLASHPDIASLDGEIEPFLALTRNGFGHNSDSDALPHLANVDELADNIFDDMTVSDKQLPPSAQLKKRWERRLLLQFPALFSDKLEHEKLHHSLDEAMAIADTCLIKEEAALQTLVLSKVFRHEPWRIAYYDGNSSSGANNCFDELLKIEEPPFVLPRNYRRSFTESDVTKKTLLFKTPPDVYRIGMYEQLFPHAEIKYIHLTRGYAQTVNGLMDGWLSPLGFFSHDLRDVGLQLSIKGYSDTTKFGQHWWKFDLPPNWKDFIFSSLDEVCLNQWMSAHRAVIASGVPVLRVSFENFLSDPCTAMGQICTYLGLAEARLNHSFPILMATEAPKSGRWKKRESQLLEMGKKKQVSNMMNSLGYSMNHEEWL